MRFLVLSSLVAAAFFAPPAAEAANMALCLAIQKNYNDCVARRQAREEHWREERWREEHWGGGWDDEPSERPRRHHRRWGGGDDVDCNAWVFQMQANHCMGD